MNTGFSTLLRVNNTADFRYRWGTKAKSATRVAMPLCDQHPVGLRRVSDKPSPPNAFDAVLSCWSRHTSLQSM